jgi:hypothetical protein
MSGHEISASRGVAVTRLLSNGLSRTVELTRITLARHSRNQRSTRRTDRRNTELAKFGGLLHKIVFSACSAPPR